MFSTAPYQLVCEKIPHAQATRRIIYSDIIVTNDNRLNLYIIVIVVSAQCANITGFEIPDADATTVVRAACKGRIVDPAQCTDQIRSLLDSDRFECHGIPKEHGFAADKSHHRTIGTEHNRLRYSICRRSDFAHPRQHTLDDKCLVCKYDDDFFTCWMPRQGTDSVSTR